LQAACSDWRPMWRVWRTRSSEARLRDGVDAVQIVPPVAGGPLAMPRMRASAMAGANRNRMDWRRRLGMELRELVRPGLVAVDVSVKSWEDAVRAAGRLLVDDHAVDDRFVDAMIHIAEEYGPYFVIAPGIALPHARPEDGVRRASMAIVRLRESVQFGNRENDPVFLVIALAAADKTQHVQALAELAHILGRKETIEGIKECKTPEDLMSIFGGNAKRPE
jgi:PTS system ascorbate-specific IIA component